MTSLVEIVIMYIRYLCVIGQFDVKSDEKLYIFNKAIHIVKRSGQYGVFRFTMIRCFSHKRFRYGCYFSVKNAIIS